MTAERRALLALTLLALALSTGTLVASCGNLAPALLLASPAGLGDRPARVNRALIAAVVVLTAALAAAVAAAVRVAIDHHVAVATDDDLVEQLRRGEHPANADRAARVLALHRDVVRDAR